MLHQIEKWIDQTNIEYQEQRISCSKFFDEFKGFYPLEFLQQSYFVIVDTIPKPNFPELRQMGLGDFIETSNNLRVYAHPKKSFIEVYIFKLVIRLRRYDTF